MKRIILVLLLAGLGSAPALAQEAMTGMFRMSHTVGEILGEQMAQALDDTVPSDQELQWQVYVPWEFDPSRPAGGFIYLDPNRYGDSPDDWTPYPHYGDNMDQPLTATRILSEYDDAKRAHQGHRHGLHPDLEIAQRALCLTSPVLVCRDFQGAKAVGFGTGRGHRAHPLFE